MVTAAAGWQKSLDILLVVPEFYDPSRPTPLLVVLHGGVGRAGIMDDPLGYAAEDGFVARRGFHR